MRPVVSAPVGRLPSRCLNGGVAHAFHTGRHTMAGHPEATTRPISSSSAGQHCMMRKLIIPYPREAVVLSKRAVQVEADRSYLWNTLGVAHYRFSERHRGFRKSPRASQRFG